MRTPQLEGAKISGPVDNPLWAELIAAHDHQVLISVLALGMSPDRAREIVQSAWMRLMEKHAAGELDVLELPGLAIRQARFLAMDSFRRAGLERRALSNVVDLAGSRDNYADIERRVMSREHLAIVARTLATCPSNAQKLFRLIYAAKSCTHTEAAAELGLSVQRVRQILCETRKKIQIALGGEEAVQ